MDALQEAYLTLDILDVLCKREQQQLQRHLAHRKTERYSNAPPSLPSIQDTEKEENSRCKVTTTRILKFDGKRATNKKETKLALTTGKSSAFSIGAWRQDISEGDKEESAVARGYPPHGRRMKARERQLVGETKSNRGKIT